jgi:hypothetical protein
LVLIGEQLHVLAARRWRRLMQEDSNGLHQEGQLIDMCSTCSRGLHSDDMCGDMVNTVEHGRRGILVLRS